MPTEPTRSSANSKSAESLFSGDDRLGSAPELLAVFDAFGEELAKELAGDITDACVKRGEITLSSVGNWLGLRPPPGLFVHIAADKVLGDMLLFLDSEAVDRWVDIILNGSADQRASRPLSGIDLALGQLLCERVGTALQRALAATGQVLSLRIVTAVADPSRLSMVRQGGGVLLVDVKLGRDPPSIPLRLAIPTPSVANLRAVLATNTKSSVTATLDNDWTEEIRRHLARTFVTLSAVLENTTIDIADVSGWEIGAVLQLKATSRSLVSLESVDAPLFWCELGKQAGMLTLRVKDEHDIDRDFLLTLSAPEPGKP